MTPRAEPVRRTSNGAAAIVVLALLVSLAGCGVSDNGRALPKPASGTGARKVIKAAVAKTNAESRSRFDLEFSLTGPIGAQQFRFAGHTDRRSGAVEADIRAGRGTFLLRNNGRDSWISSPSKAFREAMPDGRTWVHVPKGAVQGIGSTKDSDASRDLVYYLLGAERIRSTGTDTVDGVDVNTYRFDVAPDVADRVPKSRRRSVSRLIHSTGQGKLTVTGTTAIDGDGLVRKVTLAGRVTGTAGFSGKPIQIDYHMDLSEFGDRVTVEAPPKGDTAELSEARAAVTAFSRALSGG